MTKEEWDILQNSKKKQYKYVPTGNAGEVKKVEITEDSEEKENPFQVKREKEKSDTIPNREKAELLMEESYRKKAFANQQEKIGNALIKKGKGDETRLIDLKGETTPTAYKRLEIAKKARIEATKDSIKATILNRNK